MVESRWLDVRSSMHNLEIDQNHQDFGVPKINVWARVEVDRLLSVTSPTSFLISIPSQSIHVYIQHMHNIIVSS